MKNKKRWVFILDLAVAALAALAIPLTNLMFRWLPDCMATRFGLQCPACGGTRCVRYFFSGQLVQSFRANPFYFVLILYLAVALILLNVGVLLELPGPEKVARGMTDWRVVIVGAILFVLFGVIRNFV